MADKINRQVLKWEVVGEEKVANSLTRTAALQRSTVKATDELNSALSDLRANKDAERLGKQFGTEVRKGLKDSTTAAKELAAELARVGAAGKAAVAASSFSDVADSTRGKGLRLIGAAGRQLPSTQIPGLGIGTDQVSNIVRMAGAVGELTEKAGLSTKQLLGAGVAAAALSVALILLAKSFQETKAAAQADLDARTRALTLLRQGSQEEVQARINELAAKRELNQAIAQDANTLVDNLRKQNIQQFGGAKALLAEGLSVVGLGAGELAAAKENADKANVALSETSTELELLQQASGLAAQGLDDIVSAAQRIEFIGNDLSNRANADLEAYKLANTGTSEQLQNRIRDLQLELAVTANSAAQARARAEALGLETAEGQKAQEVADNLTKSQNALQTSLEILSQGFISAAIKAREADAYARQQAEDTASLLRKFNADRLKENESYWQKRADIELKYQDTLIKAAETLADAGEKALETLREKRDDLLESFGRKEVDAQQKAQQKAIEDQISFAEDSAKAARDHARELLQIQQDAQLEEEELIAARDFAGLFNSRRRVSIAIQNQNREFQEQEAERALQFKQKQESDARQYAFEQEQRAEAFRLANQDAEKQYHRQINQANANYQRQLNQAASAANQELQIAGQKHTANLNTLRNAAVAELQIIQQSAAVRKQILENELASYQEQAARLLAGGIQVNGAGSVAGFGGVAASQSGGFGGLGSINNSTRTASFTNTFNVTGSNSAELARFIDSRISNTINGYISSN